MLHFGIRILYAQEGAPKDSGEVDKHLDYTVDGVLHYKRSSVVKFLLKFRND